MERNPYILQATNRIQPNAFNITFTNSNFPNELFTFVYCYGAGERNCFYNIDMTDITVNVATWLREAVNHVFNED